LRSISDAEGKIKPAFLLRQPYLRSGNPGNLASETTQRLFKNKGISPAVMPSFLALYLGLQLGLPDSFRTGGNMTDSYLFCILLNEVYEKKFRAEKPKREE